MFQLLEVGEKLYTGKTRLSCQVENYIGGGGQGEVYAASLGDRRVALKWYYPHSLTQRHRQNLDMIIQRGPPTGRFLWPEELAFSDGKEEYGYIMSLREERFKGILDLMRREIEPTFMALATAGFHLADNYYRLHAEGLCYHDISLGNAFFDPQTGEVLICDNDNITIDGQKSSVKGSPRFMAPEIVRGESGATIQSDLFSLAVLLFYMFMINHPLEGMLAYKVDAFDPQAMNRIYGKDPVFIFDPNDERNRPVPGEHDNAIIYWPLYPEFLRQLFTDAFTSGIRDPVNGRVRETVWRAAMVQLRDLIVYCSNCGLQNIYDPDSGYAQGDFGSPCWNCGRAILRPFGMKLDEPSVICEQIMVMLNHNTRLYPYHTKRFLSFISGDPYDFDNPVAEIVQNPRNPNQWGLRNLSAETWQCMMSNGAVRKIEPQRSVALAPGLRILFGKGKRTGEVF